MGTRIAVIAALPREISALVKGIKPDPRLVRDGVYLYRTGHAIVVAGGMGAARASLAFQAAMEAGGVEQAISVGLAGGCMPEVEPGSVVEAGTVIDERTGERLETALDQRGPVLVSADAIASVREKARLAATYGASLVDMEAATVGRLAAAHGIQFRAIKGVSDGQDFELSSLAQFAGKRGEFRTVAFALHTALRPGTWRAAATLGRNSGRALEALADRVQAIIRSS